MAASDYSAFIIRNGGQIGQASNSEVKWVAWGVEPNQVVSRLLSRVSSGVDLDSQMGLDRGGHNY